MGNKKTKKLTQAQKLFKEISPESMYSEANYIFKEIERLIQEGYPDNYIRIKIPTSDAFRKEKAIQDLLEKNRIKPIVKQRWDHLFHENARRINKRYPQNLPFAKSIRNLVVKLCLEGLSEEAVVAQVSVSPAMQKQHEMIKKENKNREEVEQRRRHKQSLEQSQIINERFIVGQPYAKTLRKMVLELCLKGLSVEEVLEQVSASPVMNLYKSASKIEEKNKQKHKARINKAKIISDYPFAERMVAWGKIPVRVDKFPFPTTTRDVLAGIDASFSLQVKNAKRCQEQYEFRVNEEEKQQQRQKTLDRESRVENAHDYLQRIIPRTRLYEFRRWYIQHYGESHDFLIQAADQFIKELHLVQDPSSVVLSTLQMGQDTAIIEQITTGAAYIPAYPIAPIKTVEKVCIEQKRKLDVDIQEEHCERVVNQRNGVAQAKFKTLLMKNFAGRCAVTGWVNGGVLEAAHIEHGTRYNPSNGILMTPTMHALFDSALMGIDPATLTVHFKQGIELGEQFEGRMITPLVYDLDTERLALRWNEYLGRNHRI